MRWGGRRVGGGTEGAMVDNRELWDTHTHRHTKHIHTPTHADTHTSTHIQNDMTCVFMSNQKLHCV